MNEGRINLIRILLDTELCGKSTNIKRGQIFLKNVIKSAGNELGNHFIQNVPAPLGECKLNWWFLLIVAVVALLIISAIVSCLCCPCCLLYR